MSAAQENMGLAPAGVIRNLSFDDRTEDRKDGKEPGSVSANISSIEFKGIDTISSAIDDSDESSPHRFWLGSTPDASTSDAEIRESATTTDNPTEIKTTSRTVCTCCKSAAHRSTCCPHLPCRHCDQKGHVGTNCPKRVEEINQLKREARRRYNEKKAAARVKVSNRASCSNCKKPNHQRTTCPDLPCRHCDTIGHVGTSCPRRRDILAQAARDSNRRYKDNKAMAQGGPSPSSDFHHTALPLCSHCRQPSHRRPACPQLPCTHCNTLGHVVTLCPVKAEDTRQRMRDAQLRHKKRRDTVAGVPPSTALCTQCKQKGHRKPACPNLPCRHCGKMGHVGVGTDCPIRAKFIAQGLRKSSEKYRKKRAGNTREGEKMFSGIGLISPV